MPKKGIYISIRPHSHAHGGGANTFAWNFVNYLIKKDIPINWNLLTAEKALIIADKVNTFLLRIAKKTGCHIVHRLDEHITPDESIQRKRKHARIFRVNRLTDITVFQSEFVKNNVLPYLNPSRHEVIINGGDPDIFYDRKSDDRRFVGHVTNSVGDKKRLDLLEKAIITYPKEQFLLVGNHAKSVIPFSKYENVTIAGPFPRQQLALYYQQMKCLYFPSENDPCPNTVVEAILSGVPVCYNLLGGTVEVVRDCGLSLEQFDVLLGQTAEFRQRCRLRKDLYFDAVAERYVSLLSG
ncbi:MAG: glycosyltransferase family 4 protein [Candidatus Omnitrophica bacterium]|nr:glycosyltransferase family 4 protein [Candidatus Omnitrophota bacterium]